MKKWYLKGRMGEALAGMKEEGPHPFTTQLVGSGAVIRDANGYLLFCVTVRGNSRDRRKATRELRRWLNEGHAAT